MQNCAFLQFRIRRLLMSFFSRSRSKGYYPNANRGQSYYKRRGFFGRFVSGSSSGRMYPPYSQQGYQDTMAAQNYAAQSNFSSQNTAVTVCPKCGTSIPANSKFCLSCGERINTAMFCPECGKQIPVGSKFCLECGHKIG